MNVPREGSKRWKEILEMGCGGHYDREGEFDCDNGYDWDCEDCPVCVENIRKGDNKA